MAEAMVGKRNIPVLEAPKGRRDEFIKPYFKGAEARKPAQIMIAIGERAANRCGQKRLACFTPFFTAAERE
jgi:hypothetical protein